ncbi:MAG: hypothetical protein GY861_06680 [bacterium]|nr:hypothetical protein [bacterium]
MNLHIYYKKAIEGVSNAVQDVLPSKGMPSMPEECKALLAPLKELKTAIPHQEVEAKPIAEAKPEKVKKKRGRGRPPGAKARFKKMNKLVPYATMLENRQLEKIKRVSEARGISASQLVRNLIDGCRVNKAPVIAKRMDAMREGWKKKIKAEMEAEAKE